VSVEIKKGELKINKDNILYTLEESHVAYSEPVTNEDDFISSGKVLVNTIKKGDVYEVRLKINVDYDLNYEGGTQLIKSSSAYKLSIINKGGNQITIKLI